jgi:glutamate-1-semialdehyde 2,1-aminomutase
MNNGLAFDLARTLMPGGVSSPVRSFRAVGGTPVFISRGAGSKVFDLDGKPYLDFIMGYGPMIAGHAHPVVTEAVRRQLDDGVCFGMPGAKEAELASQIRDAMPAAERIRFVNSGTEAAMSAIRLARAATGRSIVVKCAGCYHGHVDALLVNAGSGAMTHGTPSSPGVPESLTRLTRVVPFNDVRALHDVFESHRGQIACFALEAVCGNVGVVPPAPGYLKSVRELCDAHGVMLLIDEVMTGFRIDRGGATRRFDVRPDLLCLGKIIGGGLPIGAYAGCAELMSRVSPEGPVYQAGTFSGNPLSMTAGLATLNLLDAAAYAKLESLSLRLASGMRRVADEVGATVSIQRVGSMLTVFFTEKPGDAVDNETAAMRCDRDRFAAFFHGMLDAGVMIPPSQFEAWFVSLAHDEADIDQTIEAARAAFAKSMMRSMPE